MKTNSKFTIIILTALLLSAFAALSHAQKRIEKPGSFSFAFLTDIHLTYDRNAVPGFQQAIDAVNALKPDLAITGGDLVMDCLAKRFSRADSLYNLYMSVTKRFKMPLYNTMGNHEIWGIYKEAGADKNNPEYGEKMFEKRLGKSYYSFTHKGWKFMVINSVEDTKTSNYIGKVDSVQMAWIKQELEGTDPATPIVLSTHIPFITAYTQKYGGSTQANDSSLVVINAKEVIDLFKQHTLKLVLQGHLHTVEDVFIDGIHFITGGAVSAAWWKGPNMGFEEGFVLVTTHGSDFSWRYVDYNWKVATPGK